MFKSYKCDELEIGLDSGNIIYIKNVNLVTENESDKTKLVIASENWKNFMQVERSKIEYSKTLGKELIE